MKRTPNPEQTDKPGGSLALLQPSAKGHLILRPSLVSPRSVRTRPSRTKPRFRPRDLKRPHRRRRLESPKMRPRHLVGQRASSFPLVHSLLDLVPLSRLVARLTPRVTADALLPPRPSYCRKRRQPRRYHLHPQSRLDPDLSSSLPRPSSPGHRLTFRKYTTCSFNTSSTRLRISSTR